MWKHILKAGFHWWQSWSRNSLRTGSLFSKRKKNARRGKVSCSNNRPVHRLESWECSWPSENKKSSCKRSHKCNGIGVRRIRTFPFLSTPSLTFCLWTSENQIVVVGGRSGRINQSQCMFVIGLVVPLLFLTPAIWFLLGHKWNLSDGVVGRNHNAVFTRS